MRRINSSAEFRLLGIGIARDDVLVDSESAVYFVAPRQDRRAVYTRPGDTRVAPSLAALSSVDQFETLEI